MQYAIVDVILIRRATDDDELSQLCRIRARKPSVACRSACACFLSSAAVAVAGKARKTSPANASPATEVGPPYLAPAAVCGGGRGGVDVDLGDGDGRSQCTDFSLFELFG